MYHIHKAIKRYLLSYFILCTFVGLLSTLQAAAPTLSNQQALIPYGIASPQKSQPYLLEWFRAAETGDSQWLRSLYSHYNIDVNTSNEHTNTALLLSAENGHVDCVKYLLQQGADINITDEWGNTALIRSAQKGHLDCVTYLCQQELSLIHI